MPRKPCKKVIKVKYVYESTKHWQLYHVKIKLI